MFEPFLGSVGVRATVVQQVGIIPPDAGYKWHFQHDESCLYFPPIVHPYISIYNNNNNVNVRAHTCLSASKGALLSLLGVIIREGLARRGGAHTHPHTLSYEVCAHTFVCEAYW